MRSETKSLSISLLLLPALLLFAIFLIAPLLMMGNLSFQAIDPNSQVATGYTFENYSTVVTDSYYLVIFGRTLFMSLVVTLICFLIGVPEAYIIYRMNRRWRAFFLTLTLTPLLIAVVVRTLGWVLLFGQNGVVNTVLLALGITSAPISILYTLTAVIIALVHIAVPFMIISVWVSLTRLNPHVLNAAMSLGANQFTVLTRVVIPQIIPGIISGSTIVFALCVSAFATPSILGGRQVKVAATTAYDEFLGAFNWPLGAAIAVILLVVNVTIIVASGRLVGRESRGAAR